MINFNRTYKYIVNVAKLKIMTLDFLEHMRNSQTRLHEQKIAFGLNDKKDEFVVLEDDTFATKFKFKPDIKPTYL